MVPTVMAIMAIPPSVVVAPVATSPVAVGTTAVVIPGFRILREHDQRYSGKGRSGQESMEWVHNQILFIYRSIA